MTHSPTAWLRGAGGTPFGRHEGRGPIDLMADAARQALASSALARGDIDGVLCGYATTLPHLMLSTLLCERFGLSPRYAHGMQLGGATGAAMLMAARELVRAGRCRNVLVVAGENRLTGQSRDSSIQTLAQVGDADYEVPNGASVPAYYALMASEYMHRTGITRADLAEFAVLISDGWQNKGLGTKLQELFGAREIVVGVPEFDAAWFVQTNAPDFLRPALLPELLEKFREFRGAFKLEKGQVTYVEMGQFDSEERCRRFESAVSLACDLADIAEVYARHGGRA